MKLQTSIKPRSNGTVKLQGQDGKAYLFEPNEDGDLVCDVTDEATVQHLLLTQPDTFWPFDDADYSAAEQLLQKAAEDGDDGDDGDGDGDDGEQSNPNGLPVESNTPPKTSPDKAAKANARLQKAAKGK